MIPRAVVVVVMVVVLVWWVYCAQIRYDEGRTRYPLQSFGAFLGKSRARSKSKVRQAHEFQRQPAAVVGERLESVVQRSIAGG